MKLLLVEDEEPFGTNLKEELKEYGFIVDKTDNGEEAMRLLKQELYIGAVLDLRLRPDSEIHGITLVSWIRKFYPALPIIVITGHDHLLWRAFEYEIDFWMIKPVEGKYIAQYLKRAIKSREDQEIIRRQDIEIHNLRSANKKLRNTIKILKNTIK